MDLSQVKAVTKNKKAKRRGCGTGSGLGKTSGRGHRGAGQRKGKKLPYAGFQGGNLPFIRQMPKRGFNSWQPKQYQIVNLSSIEKKAKNGLELNPEVMARLNLIKDKNKPVKILAKTEGKFNLKLQVEADKVSGKAKQIIESAGGSCRCLKR